MILPRRRYDINAKANNGYSALHRTAFIGNNDLIKFMVSKGADVTVVAKDKNTVVDMANGPFPRSCCTRASRFWKGWAPELEQLPGRYVLVAADNPRGEAEAKEPAAAASQRRSLRNSGHFTAVSRNFLLILAITV